MKRIEWSDQASHDLEEALEWYGDQSDDLFALILGRVHGALLPLARDPGIGSTVGRDGLMKWRAKKTPYLLLYVIRGDTVRIVRVVHAASDWKSYF